MKIHRFEIEISAEAIERIQAAGIMIGDPSEWDSEELALAIDQLPSAAIEIVNYTEAEKSK